jgi:excisionase family DNA binding protein
MMQNNFLESQKRSLKRMLTIPEATFGYGIGRSKFYQEIAAGRIRIRKCGRRTLVSSDDMEAWAEGLPIVSRAGEAA